MSLPITITPITGNTIDTVCIVLTGLSGLGILLPHVIIITGQIPIDRTRCPKIANTIHLGCPPRARRGRHLYSHYYDGRSRLDGARSSGTFRPQGKGGARRRWPLPSSSTSSSSCSSSPSNSTPMMPEPSPQAGRIRRPYRLWLRLLLLSPHRLLALLLLLLLLIIPSYLLSVTSSLFLFCFLSYSITLASFPSPCKLFITLTGLESNYNSFAEPLCIVVHCWLKTFSVAWPS